MRRPNAINPKHTKKMAISLPWKSMAEEPDGRQGVLREVFGRQEAAEEAQNKKHRTGTSVAY